MAIRFPENMVAYHADVEDRGHVLARLAQVEAALPNARSAASVNDLRTRRASLEWQAVLQQADDDYGARRYERALAGYREVSGRILSLIEPRFGRLRALLAWPAGETVTNALVEASAELLNHLIPKRERSRLVLQSADVVPQDELDAAARPVLSAAVRVSEEVMSTADRAAAAAEQGRWDEASTLYRNAVRGVGRDDPQLHADLLLNLGAVEVQRGETTGALEHLTSAQRQFQALDDQLGVAEALHNAGLAHLRAGRGEQAVETLDQARDVAGQASLLGLLERTNGEQPSGEAGSRSRPALRRTLASPSLSAVRTEPVASPVLTRPILSPPLIAVPDTVVARPERTDVGQLAASLGSFDLSLKLRSISRNVAQGDLLLDTPAQERQDAFERALTLNTNGERVTLQWSSEGRLGGDALRNAVYRPRINSGVIDQLGFRVRDEAEVILNLPHLYHLVLPIKMGDCHTHLGDHAEAQAQYRRASEYSLINLTHEAPDLWRRMAENVVAWGDSLYRDERTDEALPIYGLLMTEDRVAADSFFYTADSLSATGATATDWLAAVNAGDEPPELNPAVTHLLHTVRRRWAYIQAGLDFFGDLATVVSPFSFRYLQEVARYFAQRAINAEQRYIDFYTRFENGEMTRKELENAAELAGLEVDAARHREAAADATLDAAAANVDFAQVRRQNAQDQLDQFNDVAWELEQLAGHIARGNAWTGDDLPDLDYGAGGRYHFDGPKHEVLQDLTRRQTSITNGLQRARMSTASCRPPACTDGSPTRGWGGIATAMATRICAYSPRRR